jgi:osmoprotectant transport system permease protein
VLELAAAAAQRAADPMPSGPSTSRDDAVSVPSTTVTEAPTGS